MLFWQFSGPPPLEQAVIVSIKFKLQAIVVKTRFKEIKCVAIKVKINILVL